MDPQVQGVLMAAKATYPHIFISDSLVMADAAVKMVEAGCSSVMVLGVDFMSENVRAILDDAGHQDTKVYRMAAEDIGCSLAEVGGGSRGDERLTCWCVGGVLVLVWCVGGWWWLVVVVSFWWLLLLVVVGSLVVGCWGTGWFLLVGAYLLLACEGRGGRINEHVHLCLRLKRKNTHLLF